MAQRRCRRWSCRLVAGLGRASHGSCADQTEQGAGRRHGSGPSFLVVCAMSVGHEYRAALGNFRLSIHLLLRIVQVPEDVRLNFTEKWEVQEKVSAQARRDRWAHRDHLPQSHGPYEEPKPLLSRHEVQRQQDVPSSPAGCARVGPAYPHPLSQELDQQKGVTSKPDCPIAEKRCPSCKKRAISYGS